jgi:hypothetical protein
MLAKLKFTTKVQQKIKFLRLKIMCLRVSYKKKLKILKKFGILKITEEKSRIRSWIRIRILYSEVRIQRSGVCQ